MPHGRNVIFAMNHTDRFEAVNRLVMERIESLVDSTHRTPADAP